MEYEDMEQVCSDCGQSMKKSQTAFTVDYSNDVGVIRTVPTLVCPFCDKEWIEGNARKGVRD